MKDEIAQSGKTGTGAAAGLQAITRRTNTNEAALQLASNRYISEQLEYPFMEYLDPAISVRNKEKGGKPPPTPARVVVPRGVV